MHRARGIRDRPGERGEHGEHARDLVDREATLDGDRDRVDELRRARRDDHAADDGARPLSSDDLHEAVGDAHHLRARVGGERQLVDVAVDRAGREVLLLPADRRDLGSGEDVRRDATPLERDHGVAEGVEDRGAPLHRCDGCQGHERRAVAGGVDVRHRRASDPVDADVTRFGQLHARLGQADARRVGDRSDRHEAVAALDGAPVGEGHHDPVADALDALRTRFRQHRHAAAAEHLLEHDRGVVVFTGQHLVARRDEGDLRAEVHVGRRELGARDARADHDEVLGQRLHVVELGPGENALTVGHGARQLARRRADRDDEGVGLDPVEVGAARARRDDHRVRVVEAAVAGDDAHARVDELAAHVVGLLPGEREQPLVDGGEVDGDLGLQRPAALALREEFDPQIGCLRDRDRGVGGRDEALGGNDVGDDRRPADPGPLDEGDLGPELGGGERRFVAPGAPAEDGDGRGIGEAR